MTIKEEQAVFAALASIEAAASFTPDPRAAECNDLVYSLRKRFRQ